MPQSTCYHGYTNVEKHNNKFSENNLTEQIEPLNTNINNSFVAQQGECQIYSSSKVGIPLKQFKLKGNNVF